MLLAGVSFLLAAAFTVLFTQRERTRYERFWNKRCGPVIHEVTSAFSQIRVREKGQVRSLMFVRPDGNEGLQTSINLESPATLELAYTRAMFASLLHQPKPERVLIIGLGGGGMVRFLNAHFPNTQVDAVEIDPAVVTIAETYFETRPGPKTRILTEDAFVFFGEDDGTRYDAIYMDAFLKPSEDTDADGAPQRLKTVAFLQQVRGRLADGGVVTFNLIENDGTQRDLQSIHQAFGALTVYRADGSRNLAVTTHALEERIAVQRAAELDASLPLSWSFADLLKGREPDLRPEG